MKLINRIAAHFSRKALAKLRASHIAGIREHRYKREQAQIRLAKQRRLGGIVTKPKQRIAAGKGLSALIPGAQQPKNVIRFDLTKRLAA